MNAHYTPAIVQPVGERRAAWWVFAERIRRLGHEPPGQLSADDLAPRADDAVLSTLLPYARCTYDELASKRYVESAHEVQARWVDAHIERPSGWLLVPAALLEQLHELTTRHLASRARPLTLRLTPRRQRRHLNAQLLFLGSPFDVLLNPDDAATANIRDGDHVVVCSGAREIIGIARVDAGVRAGVVSVPHGHAKANVNLLTSIRQVNPLTGMARYSQEVAAVAAENSLIVADGPAQ